MKRPPCVVAGCTKPATLTHTIHGAACLDHAQEIDTWGDGWDSLVALVEPPTWDDYGDHIAAEGNAEAPACGTCGDTGIQPATGRGSDGYERCATCAAPPPDTPRSDLLREAEQLVNNDRNAQYGDPNQDFARTAAMWSAYIHGVAERNGIDIPMDLLDTWDVAWMQVLLKASRSTTSPGKRDHYADAAGYAACGWDCAKDITKGTP